MAWLGADLRELCGPVFALAFVLLQGVVAQVLGSFGIGCVRLFVCLFDRLFVRSFVRLCLCFFLHFFLSLFVRVCDGGCHAPFAFARTTSPSAAG